VSIKKILSPKATAARGAIVGKNSPRRASARLSPELELQKLCEKYLKKAGIRFIRIPDSLWAFINGKFCPKWLKIFCASYLAGLPDLTILGREKVLYVELKAKKGVLTESQKTFAQEFPLCVCRTFEEFRGAVDEWRAKS
jgi:hypothetical protein